MRTAVRAPQNRLEFVPWGRRKGAGVKWLRQFSRTLPKPTKSKCSPSRVTWLVLPIATMLARIAASRSGQALTTGRELFPLGFRLSPHLPRSKFNVAESAFHDLEPEEKLYSGTAIRVCTLRIALWKGVISRYPAKKPNGWLLKSHLSPLYRW